MQLAHSYRWEMCEKISSHLSPDKGFLCSSEHNSSEVACVQMTPISEAFCTEFQRRENNRPLWPRFRAIRASVFRI